MMARTVDESVASRGGGLAHIGVYRELMRLDQREPEDFIFAGGAVDFVMQKVPRALAIQSVGENSGGLIQLRAAALGSGVDLAVLDEAAAILDPVGAASRLVGE